MELSIAGYKFNLETLLLIALVGFIMFGHTICGCSSIEGFDIKQSDTGKPITGTKPTQGILTSDFSCLDSNRMPFKCPSSNPSLAQMA